LVAIIIVLSPRGYLGKEVCCESRLQLQKYHCFHLAPIQFTET
jgi:hypothetical protein